MVGNQTRHGWGYCSALHFKVTNGEHEGMTVVVYYDHNNLVKYCSGHTTRSAIAEFRYNSSFGGWSTSYGRNPEHTIVHQLRTLLMDRGISLPQQA